MTQTQLIGCAKGLGPRDFSAFAIRVFQSDAALGITVSLHAEAADGNSPDLIPEWIISTLDDQAKMRQFAWNAPTARAWWMWKYADAEAPARRNDADLPNTARTEGGCAECGWSLPTHDIDCPVYAARTEGGARK